MKTGFLLLLLIFASASLLVGCASTSETSNTPGQPTSDLPWNRPQDWEGSGALGSAMGH